MGGIHFNGTAVSDIYLDNIKFEAGFFNLISASQYSVKVELASNINLVGFKYIDTRANGAASAHTHLYKGLIDSEVTSYHGAMTFTGLVKNNIITADMRNKAIRITGTDDGNTLKQVYYDGILNQTDTSKAIGNTINSIVNMANSGSIPRRAIFDGQEAWAENNIFTNKGATGPINLTIPDAKVGRSITIIKYNLNTIRIGTTVGHTFKIGASSNIYISNLTTQADAVIKLICVTDTEWMILYSFGTWGLTSS